MSVLESIGYFFVWVASFAISFIKSVLSLLNWFKPAVDFVLETFSFLPGWVSVLLIACVAIEIIIFLLNLGGE